MKLFNKHTKTLFSVLIVSFSFAITSCSNPADSNEEEHDHLPVGAVLFLNGEEIVRIENADIEGGITVAASEETALITVRFIAEDGDLFQPEESKHSLLLNIDDTSIAEAEQHPEDGEWSFHVVGKSAGSTSLSFKLFHVGHEDFVSPPIPVTVTSN